MMSHIIFKVVTEWESESIVALYRSAGWWKDEYDAGSIPSLISSSYRFVIGYCTDTNQTVAMGRILSDTVITGIIQDMSVLKTFQNQGIGSSLLEFLVTIARNAGLNRICLVAEPGTEDFYKKSGFIIDDNKIFLLQKAGPE